MIALEVETHRGAHDRLLVGVLLLHYATMTDPIEGSQLSYYSMIMNRSKYHPAIGPGMSRISEGLFSKPCCASVMATMIGTKARSLFEKVPASCVILERGWGMEVSKMSMN
jgi:hypothetical protein